MFKVKHLFTPTRKDIKQNIRSNKRPKIQIKLEKYFNTLSLKRKDF